MSTLSRFAVGETICKKISLWPFLSLLFWGACEAETPMKVPLDIKERFPAAATLSLALPGKAGPEGSASAALWQEIAGAQQAMSATTVLQEYLQDGGEMNRDLTIILALDGAPRVVDQAIRYTRRPSRLDVERVGDHAFCYLQLDRGQGFDPDQAISEQHLILEGATVVPERIGTRASINRATGLASPDAGYLRFQANRGGQYTSTQHTAMQVDYQRSAEQTSLHFSYLVASGYDGDPPLIGLWLVKRSEGNGFVYASQRDGTTPVYRLIAQYLADGSMAIWQGDGTLWGCFDAEGGELGNAEDPAGCEGFNEPFPVPPALEIWPALPAGLPAQ